VNGRAPAVEVEGLSQTYGDRKALDSVSLTVGPGEVFALLGPNGGGKTTLFRILATFLPPASGTFRIDGISPLEDVREVRRHLGVVFQSPSLDRKLTVEENLLFQGEIWGLPRATLRKRCAELLARLSLESRAKDRVETLSGGLARRVEIAKALLHAPRVLLLDEPSTGLDPLARRTLRALLAELAQADRTAVLLTTHLFDEAEAADRIGILDRGRLVALGSPAELKREVGGDVLVLVTRDRDEATALAADVVARLGSDAGRVTALDASVRIERPAGHTLVPSLVETFGARFRSLTLGAPSLEDVFVVRTGHSFEEPEREAA
jgi:ABC-2 type transport system ATP-binding protein